MTNVVDIDSFNEVRECDYKGEHYSVRDNGAIMRHSQGRKRPLDGIWTFGKDTESMYKTFGGEIVHRIVTTAFHGEAPTAQHVVDHIDTNHSNNRPENLRWLTKLDNILLNDITRQKVIYICGSVEAFLENPSLLYGHESEDKNFSWMRAVTRAESKATIENLKRLVSRPHEVKTKGAHVGDWIFKEHRDGWQPDYTKKDRPNVPSENEAKPKYETVQSLQYTSPTYGRWNTDVKIDDVPQIPFPIEEEKRPAYAPTTNPLAVQIGWTPNKHPEFTCCPIEVSANPLQDYLANLEIGKVFLKSDYGESTILEFTKHEDSLLVITKLPGDVKNFGLTKVVWNGDVFVHESMGTYFEENGARAAFAIAQGKEWDGPDSIDFYC